MFFVSTFIEICSLAEVGSRGADFSMIISCLDPQASEPECLSKLDRRKREILRFDDLIDHADGKQAPSLENISQLIQVGRSEHEKLLIHCHQGISRSTAGAMIILASRYPDRVEELSDFVLNSRSCPWPNSLMLELADDELGLGGQLSEQGLKVRAKNATLNPEWVNWLSTTHRRREVEELAARASNT